MDVGEIVDRKSLEAWLNSLPQGTEAEKAEAHRRALMIAHRAAMRILPVFWHWSVEVNALEISKFALSVLRSVLVSGVSAMSTSERLWAAAVVALQSQEMLTHFDREFDDLSAVAAISAKSAVRCAAKHGGDDFFSSVHAVDSAAAAGGHVFDFWPSTQSDCAALKQGRDLHTLPLWSAENPLADTWADARQKVLAQVRNWKFWVNWYDKALRGVPQDWDLLTKIALIDPKDWEQGADHVNGLIAEIQLKHIAETQPLGEDAIDKGADGLWHRVGRSEIDDDILEDACDRVEDTVKRIEKVMKQGQSNVLTALNDDLRYLKSALKRYRSRPLRLHDTFLGVQRHIVRDLASGELPDDHLVDDLNTDLGTAALDMRNACAKTAQVVTKRTAARFGALDERERTAIVQIAEAAAYTLGCSVGGRVY